MDVKSRLPLKKFKSTGAKRKDRGENRDKEIAAGHKEKPKEKKHQLRTAREQGAMCIRQCGVHDDVVVGCHGNDAMGGG